MQKNIYKEIEEYCVINGITNTEAFIEKCLQQGFNIIKFGLSPADNVRRERDGIINFEDNSPKSQVNDGLSNKSPKIKIIKKS